MTQPACPYSFCQSKARYSLSIFQKNLTLQADVLPSTCTRQSTEEVFLTCVSIASTQTNGRVRCGFIRRRSSDAPSDSLSRLPYHYIHTYATLVVGLFIQFNSFQLDEARLLWCSPSSPHPLPLFANWHTFTMSLHPRGLPTYLSSIYVHFSEGFSESRTAAPSENPHLPLPRRRRDAAFSLRPWLTTRVRRKPFVRAPSGGWSGGGRWARHRHPRSDATDGAGGQHGVCGRSHDNGKGEGAKDVA